MKKTLKQNFMPANLLVWARLTLQEYYWPFKKCYTYPLAWNSVHINDQKKIDWITNEMENKFTNPLPLEKKEAILQKLNEGVMFEKFFTQNMLVKRDFPWKEEKAHCGIGCDY